MMSTPRTLTPSGSTRLFAAALTIALAAAAILSPCGAIVAEASPSQRVDERLRSTFARAEIFLQAGEPEQVIEPLTTVISALDPGTGTPRLDAEGQALLIRSLAYRADAHLVLGERDAADADLERLLTLYPRVSIDGFQLSSPGVERFARAEARLVGTLSFSLSPMDTRLRVDGTDIAVGTTVYRVLAGNHSIEGFLPGFTRFSEDVEVRADRSQEVSIALDRVSAVVKLMTRPVGATVVIDGGVVGATSGVASRDWVPSGEAARYPRQEFSAEMEIEGLMPGEHTIEIFLDGYRSFNAPLVVPDLGDYRVGGVVLARSLGLVLLRDLSPDAEVWVDGRRAQPEPPSRAAEGGGEMASNAYRLSLDPGQYRVTVSQGDGGVFEENITVADRRNVALTVRLRPGLTFLGVVGGDELGAAALDETLAGAFVELDYWTFLDRSGEAERVLQRSGATASRLRSAAESTAVDLDWEGIQATTSRELPGSVFVLAVLGDDALAASADLWIWPGAPGPAAAERVRIELTDRSEVEGLARRLSNAMDFEDNWAGMELIDSGVVMAPVVAAVTPGGPAEAAGVQVGDVLTSVAGNAVGTVANAASWLSTFFPGATVAMGLGGVDGERTVDLRLGSSPVVVSPNDPDLLYSVVWGMTAAAIGRLDAPVASWLAELNQAAVLIKSRDWDAALRILRGIQAPSGPGVGQGLADYWLGIALAESGDTEAARAAFERVLAEPEARYLRNDGPFLAPMARVRLQTLAGEGNR